MSNTASPSSVTTSDYVELAMVNKELSSELTKVKQEVELYKFQLDQLKQYIFGKRSEKQHRDADSSQVDMFNANTSVPPTDDTDEEIDIPAHKRKRKSKKSFPKDLPVEEIEYSPEDKQCAHCDTTLKEFSRDIRDEYEFQPARFFIKRHITVNCSCPQCESVYSGETPIENKPVIPGSQMGAGFLAHMTVSRVLDHLPYYRQSQIYEREGVTLPDKTLSRYGLAIGLLLEPVAKAIKAHLMGKDYLQADETRMMVQEDGKNHHLHTGQIWVLNDPISEICYFEYHPGRGKEHAHSFLGDYRGTLQTDGYVCYDDYAGEQAGCMSHGRRYFRNAKKVAKKDATPVLSIIGKLYHLEKRFHREYFKENKGGSKKKDDDYFEKLRLFRQEHSVAVLDQLKEYLEQLKHKWLLEEHPMYKAIHYMLNRFDIFYVYTTDGRYQIDNNPIERIIRPIAIGRNNWMFAGTHDSARMSTVMMSVVYTCKMLKINPQRYLESVLPILADQSTTSVEGLAPWEWKARSE